MGSVLSIVAVRDTSVHTKLDLMLVIATGIMLIMGSQLNVEEMMKLLQDAVDRVKLPDAQILLLMEFYVVS